MKASTPSQLPDAVVVSDPFDVGRLIGDALDQCGRRVQLNTRGNAVGPPTRSTPLAGP